MRVGGLQFRQVRARNQARATAWADTHSLACVTQTATVRVATDREEPATAIRADLESVPRLMRAQVSLLHEIVGVAWVVT